MRRLICAALAAAFIAQTPSMAASDDLTALSGLTVMARPARPVSGIDVNANHCLEALKTADPDRKPPKLVSTYPKKGAGVRPGLLIVRLTFDQPMSCNGRIGSYPYHRYPCPTPLESPMISYDRRTFLTLCRVEASIGYGLVFDGFTSLAGHPMQAYQLDFYTTPFARISTIKEAIGEDPDLHKPAPSKP